MKFIIEAENLSFGFNNRTIINAGTFKIYRAKVTAVIGKNGCGKSTLLKLLGKILVPKAGNLYLDNKKLDEYSAFEISAAISYLGQNNKTAFDITVGELIETGACVISKPKDWNLDAYLSRYDLNILKFTKLSGLSGGQRQLAFLALALLKQPRMLLLDEPTNHLDIKNQITLLESLMMLNKSQNMSIVIALHDLNLAIKYADYVIHIDDDGEFTIGPTNDILTIDNIKAWYGVDAELLTSSDGQVINFPRSGSLMDFPM